MKIIEVKAGERKRIIRLISNSMQAKYNFVAEPIAPGQFLSGRVEVHGSRWLFPKPVKMQELVTDNTVDKGMWDTVYRVYVVPDCDVKIMFIDSRLRKIGVYLAITIMLIALGAIGLSFLVS